MKYVGKIKAAIRRKKFFSDGTQPPIDRNDRARVMALAHNTRGQGNITRAAVDILRVLLYQFANLKDGRCFPSYEKIADAAKCSQRTVGRCLPDLEAAGFLTWVNRIVRIRERVEGLGHIWATTWRVKRTSNAYSFPAIATKPHQNNDKRQKDLGTSIQDFFSSTITTLKPENEVDAALLSLQRELGINGAT